MNTKSVFLSAVDYLHSKGWFKSKKKPYHAYKKLLKDDIPYFEKLLTKAEKQRELLQLYRKEKNLTKQQILIGLNKEEHRGLINLRTKINLREFELDSETKETKDG